MDGIPIPTQIRPNSDRSRRQRLSSNEYSSSEESSGHCTPIDANSPSDGFCSLSRSFHSSSHFNVYGTSPRTTSVMFQYYNSPQQVYNKPPLSRARSSDIGANGEAPRFVRANGVSGNSVTSPNKLKVVNAAGGSNTNHLSTDRPRAWSESDKNRTNAALQNSRMNALKKLRMKLGRTGNQRKLKSDQDDMNRSAASITSLEKVEEGRQLGSISQTSNRLSADISDLSTNMGSMTMQNETSMHDSSNSLHSHVSTIEEDVPKNIYLRFLSEHTCYDLMPTSSKLVILDTRLEVSKAFDALVANNLRSAPLWNEEKSSYVGMLTVSDFLKILLAYHKSPVKSTSDLQSQHISTWRKVLNSSEDLIHVYPEQTLCSALNVLMKKKIRRLPVINPLNGDIYHVVNYRRILHFLHLFMAELPKPDYMNKSLLDLGIGTFGEIATISENEEVVRALELIEEHRVSGLPVVDDHGAVKDLFTKTDVLMLAGENLFHDLSIKVGEILKLTKKEFGVSPELLEEDSPQLVRKIPGSPALPRRNKQGAATRKTSKESKQPAHPFLRPHSEPSPLIKGVTATQVTKRSSAHIKGHPVLSKQKSKESVLPTGAVLSPDRNQRRHRHASTNSCKGSMATHLVLVDIHETLSNVVDSIVFNDALQAVIVDHGGQAKGIVSIGDVLRFMIMNTDGKLPSNTDQIKCDELQSDSDILENENETEEESLTNGESITRQ